MDKTKGKKINQEKVDSKNVELNNLKLQLARALADYDNLRKRVEREQDSIVKLASSILITKMLPVVDMLESAQKHLNDGGLAICIGEVKNILREEGAGEIEVKPNDLFNEQFYEAIDTVEGNGDNNGKVVEVVLPGWKFSDGSVIRHSKVKVYSSLEKTTSVGSGMNRA